MHKLITKNTVSIEIQNMLIQIHLYKDPVEAIIKTVIWFIAFAGGVLTAGTSGDDRAIGGAYLIFSLSLLMEFAPQIWEKTLILARVINLVCCALLSVVLVMSMSVLFGIQLSSGWYAFMLVAVIIVMIYIAIDAALVWAIPSCVEMKEMTTETNGFINENSEIRQVKTEFEERLTGGALGELWEDINE